MPGQRVSERRLAKCDGRVRRDRLLDGNALRRMGSCGLGEHRGRLLRHDAGTHHPYAASRRRRETACGPVAGCASAAGGARTVHGGRVMSLQDAANVATILGVVVAIPTLFFGALQLWWHGELSHRERMVQVYLDCTKSYADLQRERAEFE